MSRGLDTGFSLVCLGGAIKQIGYMTDLTCFNAVMARLKNFVWLGGLQRGVTRGYGFD